ncbi:MAG: hypothetical protein Q8R72_16490 [Hylemonella sp.]|nr:hypothetical protein [Hylemonella sp.]
MPLLFRANASRREKIYTLGFLSLLGLAIYGMTSRFVPNPEVKSVSGYLAFPLAIALFLPLAFDRHPSNKMASLGFLKRWLLYIFILIFLYVFSWFSLAKGAPSLITHFFGQDQVDKFSVIWKSDGGWKRRECDYSIKVQESTSLWQTKVCLSKEFWQGVTLGDTLTGKRRRTSFGGMLEELDH